jgi:hypothetical protein
MPRAKQDTDKNRAAIVALVRRTLSAHPETSTTELKEKASKIDKSVARLDTRVFHGRYVLAVMRALKGTRRRPTATKEAPAPVASNGKSNGRQQTRSRGESGPSPTAVRAVLLELAQAVAGSDTKTLVATIGQIDRYVERITRS